MSKDYMLDTMMPIVQYVSENYISIKYNPEKEEHPRHAGDLPPVLSNDGTAWMEIYTGRFYPMDVVGRTIVLHEMPDDFKTQPSGDSGMKIACGEIKAWEQECKNKNGNE